MDGSVGSRARGLPRRADADGLSDSVQHALEDQVVNRVERVPVGASCESMGIEDGCLVECRSGVVAVHLELEPDAAWSLHLGSEAQEPILLECLHPPEVERVSDRQPNGIPAPAAKTDAANDLVEESA